VTVAGAPGRPLAVPLVVGVTGHRDLVEGDVAGLAARVDTVLSEIAGEMPHSPLVLLSPMAAGADTLVAEIALRRGLEVVACLPMPVEDYRADFDDDEYRRFGAVLDRCTLVHVVGHAPKDAAARNSCYEAADAYLARNSDLLLALWDGVESDNAAGTSAVVRTRLHGMAASKSALLEPLDTGSVYWIVTRRRSNPPTTDSLRTERLYPDPVEGESDPASAERAANDRLDVLNRDLALAGTRAGDEQRDRVLPAVDGIAKSLQWRSLAVGRMLYVLAFLAASAQIVLKDDTWSTVGKIVLLGVALVVLLVARRADVDCRYEDYRALAEGLRVADAWRRAGITAPVDRFYLRMQAGELQWIRRALRAIALVAPVEAVADPRPALDGWIAHQKSYYEGAARRERASQRRCDRWAFALTVLNLCAGALVAVLLVVPYPPVKAFVTDHADVMHGILPLFIAWAALSAGLLWSYASERRFAESARRYGRMGLLYARAQRRLPLTTGDELAIELGRESLAEHADWLLTRRARPVSVFKV
jgi:hypothetical protein